MTDPRGDSKPALRERRYAAAMLALMALSYLSFAFFFVPRLTNPHFGDVEFTGWSGPIGERLLRGERPYVDFVLPIPPGSFLMLAAVQKLMGRALLQQELWLNTAAHLLMALIGYAIAVRLTTRTNALMVALSTLVALFWLHKECAYDHTAQLVVWVSFATGIRAMLEAKGRRRELYWVMTGFFPAFTLLFKQSTGLGAVLGWVAALGYLFLVSRRLGERALVTSLDLGRFLTGVAVGIALLWLTLLLLGSSFSAYYAAVFVDGPRLKGGSVRLMRHVVGYLTIRDAWISSLAFTIGLALIGARVFTRYGRLHWGDEPKRSELLDGARAGFLAAATIALFGGAIALLLARSKALPTDFVLALDRFKVIPYLGLVLVCGFFLGHLRRSAKTEDPAAARLGHAVNALTIAVIATTLLHNTSAPEFRAFYDNNPIIPLTFLFVYGTLDRAELDKLKFVVIICIFATFFGARLDRGVIARMSVGRVGQWAGMKVSERGKDIVLAARRVQSLTGPEDTVLVLPEDVQLAALIGRPRPPIRGAIVFVDQYAEHLASGDIATLEAHPPKVIVIHPPQMHLWTQLFRIWSGDSGAQRILEHAQQQLLPRHYRLESVTNTRWLWRDATLEIWVRVD